MEKMASTMLYEEELARDRLYRDTYTLLEKHSTPAAAGEGCAFNEEPPEYIFVRKNRASAKADAAVCSTADGAVVKRVRGHKLYSLNRELPYGDKTEDDHVQVIGRVLGVLSAEDLPREEYILLFFHR